MQQSFKKNQNCDYEAFLFVRDIRWLQINQLLVVNKSFIELFAWLIAFGSSQQRFHKRLVELDRFCTLGYALFYFFLNKLKMNILTHAWE